MPDAVHLYDLEAILDKTVSMPPRRMVAVLPYDKSTLEAVFRAESAGIIEPVYIGDERRIREQAVLNEVGVNPRAIIHSDELNALEQAALLIREKKADFIMKGMVSTGTFIHLLLDPKWKIRTEKLLSHVGLFEIPQTKRLFLVSDAAINIQPNFTRKIQIIRNAVQAVHSLGMGKVAVAMLAAVEKVNLPAMPATLDAFLMKKYAETGVFGSCEIDGPFALDNALIPERAKTKGIGGIVAGNADVLIVPNIETGNVIWKTITCLYSEKAAGLVLGGACPIVVPSRSDDAGTKYFSIQFARLLMQ